LALEQGVRILGVVNQLNLLFSVGHVFIEVELEALLLPLITDRESWANFAKHHVDISTSADVVLKGISSCLV